MSLWTTYINGTKQIKGNWSSSSLRTAEMWFGGNPTTSGIRHNIIGTIAYFSVRAVADHKGQSFEVAENPYDGDSGE